MNQKIFIGIVIIITIIFFLYWYFVIYLNNIRYQVLNSLEQQLKFCKILKDSIFFNTGKFWLICNGRPFYATYENNNITYSLNGWSFLKREQKIWNDLSSCNFYKSERINEKYKLSFYCPKNLNSSEIKEKVYLFNPSSFDMEKTEEKNFLDTLSKDLTNNYYFLSSCQIEKFRIINPQSIKYPPILWLSFRCDDGIYEIGTDFLTIPIQPPVLSANLSYKERAKISFQKTFNMTIDDISTESNTVFIISHFRENQFIIKYEFKELPTVGYQINCTEPQEKCLSDILNYFVFPPVSTTTPIKLIKKSYSTAVYKIGDNIITVNLLRGNIIRIWRNMEGIWDEI